MGAKRWAALIAASMLAACGGGSSDGGGGNPAPNQAPVATITAPAEGATFRAGDTITFGGSATDGEDGTIPESGLTWWAELHHDTHAHPFQPETTGGSGSVTIPVRGETSDNVWYRFHLRATDSGGLTHEVTRDIQPQKAQITLATQPAGLALTLDGQPVTGPHTVTGVVGIERDLGAATQVFNGRSYRFDGWSDGLGATHTISTPATNTTYTASFTDVGPANAPPTVTLSAASTGTVGVAMTLTATANDGNGIAQVEFLDGATVLTTDTTSPYSTSWTPATAGTHVLTARATDTLGASTTSAVVNVDVAAGGALTATLTAPANLAVIATSPVTLTATATGSVAGVEFQVDGVMVGSEDTSAPYSISLDTGAYAAGQHLIRARARDAAGNRSAWSAATVRFDNSVAVPAGITRNESWGAAVSSATAFAQAPDGRIFVAQQGGQLRVVKTDGTLEATPFHTFTTAISGERGLLGVAFHPNFASNGYVYVYYTASSPAAHNRISRVVANIANVDVSTGAETVLVDLPNLSTSTIHNGGAIHFGAGGKLYAAVGDNSSSTKAQDVNDLFGKLLRFNDDGSIPNDNPHCTTSELRCAVWARGLRNPFTFAIQPGTGRIHINDVGQDSWEEINLGAAAANYGWPASEGPNNTAGFTAPLFNYRHAPPFPAGSGPSGFFLGRAIAGGAFYPTTGPFPATYRGGYFFADYVNKWVARIDLANDNAAYAFSSVGGNPVDMLVGLDGALYVLTQNDGIARFTAP